MALPSVVATAIGNNRTMPGENKQARHPHMAVAPKTGGGSNGPSAVKKIQFQNKAPAVSIKKPS